MKLIQRRASLDTTGPFSDAHTVGILRKVNNNGKVLATITQRRHHFAAFGLLALAQVSVGINITGSKYLVAIFPVFFILTGRFLVAAILLLPLHWFSPERKIPLKKHIQRLNRKDWLFIFMQAICAGVLFNFFMVYGLRYTNAQTAGIITSTLPALIAISSWFILKEKFTLKKTICVGCATLGLIVIASYQANTGSIKSSLWGEILIFISLLPETAYYVLAKIPTRRLPIFLMSGTINAINAVILLPFLIFQINWHSLSMSFLDLGVLVLIGLSSGIFYVFWYLGSDKVDAILASLATAIMPIATVVIAWLVLGETLSIYHLIGMILAVFSIIAYAL